MHFLAGVNLHALFDSGTAPATMLRDPFCKPETPIPATARPTIKKVLDVARAQRSDPSSKTKKKTRNVHFVGKYVYSLPVSGCKTALYHALIT